MISGRQIREARALMGWTSVHLANTARLSLRTVMRVEKADDWETVMTASDNDAIRRLSRPQAWSSLPLKAAGSACACARR
jgi:DNA-binding XRE family transcriptional regulator